MLAKNSKTHIPTIRSSELRSLGTAPCARLLLCVLLPVLVAAFPARGFGQQAFSGMISLDKQQVSEALQSVWNIQADKMTYDQETQVYEAEGDVRISSGDRLIKAAYASVDMQKRRADLWGSVSIQYGRNWLKGEHVVWNLDSETGWLDNGVIFFAENNFFVQGQSISKTGPTQFNLKEGFITGCNPADPDWKIQYGQMNINVGGAGVARDTSIWAKNVPIGYLPFLRVPIETNRQSGFLLPWAGHSTLNGYEFEIPYYWAIRQDMDATFYARYMQHRGFMAGAEYRINNKEFGEGVFMFNYLNDQADAPFLLSQGYPFQTEDRYWFRDRYNVELPWQIQAKVDLDFVSDRNFLQEFYRGSSSLSHSDRVFQDYFGRGILYDETSLVRESTIYLEKKGESEVLSMDVRYWQQLDNSTDAFTAQKLPSFSFTSIPKWVGETPFYYTLESSFVNYWRRQGDTDQRLDLHPRIYYPLHLGNYLDIEPSAGIRTTTYTVQWDNQNFDTLNERGLADARVEMSTRLNRVYPIDFANYTAVQHSIRPEVSYEYAAQSIAGHLPGIDHLDLDQSRNGVRYGFSTFLTARETTWDAQGNPVTGYRELLRFRAFQFFNVEQPPPFQDPLFNTQVMKDGLSPVGLRLDVMPRKYITLSYDLDLDWNSTGQGNAQDLYMTLDSGQGHILRVDYQQLPDPKTNEITAEVLLKTFRDIYLTAYFDYSLDQDVLFKQGYGFRYFRGCWGIGFAYEREGNDNRFLVSLDLLGLGTLGHSNSTLGRSQFGEPRPEYQRPETWALAR
jgi:LPS-assembly protein